jgi:hypothetical protein
MAVTGASNDNDDDSPNDDDLGHFRLETMMPMSSLPAMFGGSSRIGNKPLPPPKPSNIRLIAAANGVVASLNRCNNNGKPQLQPKPNACARTVPSSTPGRLTAPSRSCASKVLPVSPNIADKEPRMQKEIHLLDTGMQEHSTTVVEVGSEELEVQHSLQLTCPPVSELIFDSTDGQSNKLLEKSSTAPFLTMSSSDPTNLITVPTPAENTTPVVISTAFPVPHFIQVPNTHGPPGKPNTTGSSASPLAEQETLSMVQDDKEDLAGNLCLRKEHRDWVNESPASETAKHDRNLGGFAKEVEWIQDKEEINVEKEEIKQIQERAEETQQKDGKIENKNQTVEKINRIVTIEEQSQNTERKMEQGEEEEGSEREEIMMEQLVIIEKELDYTEKMPAALIGKSCSDKTGSTHVNEVVPTITLPAITVPALSGDHEKNKFVPTSLNLNPASKNECIPNAGKPFLPSDEVTYLASSPVDSLASLETISNILDQSHSLQHRKHSVGSRKDSGIGLEDFSPTWEQDIEEEAISEEDSGDVLLPTGSEEEEAALKSPGPSQRGPSFQRSQLPVPANRSAPRRSQPDSGRSTPSGARSFAGPSSGLRQPAVYFNLGPRPFYSSSTAASGSQSLLSLPVVRTCHGNSSSSSNKTANSRGSTAHLHHIPRQNLPANHFGRPSSSNFLSGWPNRSPVTYVPSPTYRSSYGSLSCIDLHQGLATSLSSSPDELLVWEGGSGRSTPSCRRPLSGSRIPLRMVNSGPRRASLPPTSLASQYSGHFWPPSEARNVWKTSSVHEVSWSMRGML